MSWQLAYALFMFIAVLRSLAQRSYSQKTKLSASMPAALSYVLGVVPIGIVVGLLGGPVVHWSAWLVFLLALEGTFIALYTWISYRAMRILPLARFQVIFQLHALVVIILGWVTLGETLSLLQICGAVVIAISSILAIRAPRKADRELHRKTPMEGVLLTLVGTVLMGIGLVAEKATLGHMNTSAYFIYGFGAQALALLAIAVVETKPRAWAKITPHDLWQSTLLGLSSALVGFFYIIAITHANNISLITALKAFLLPLTAVAAHAVLRERDNNRTLWFAIALGVIGVVITAL